MIHRSVSQLGFIDIEHRSAPKAFAKRPTSLREIAAAGQELGIDVFFRPQYMWIAEEYLSAPLPEHWSQSWDEQHQAYYYYHSQTQDCVWESPNAEFFRDQYLKQLSQDEARGASVIGMASRSTARQRLEASAHPKPGVPDRVGPNFSSGADTEAKSTGGAKVGLGRLKRLRSKLKQAARKTVALRVKKGNAALRGGDTPGNVYTPKMFEELCQYLGIHIVDRDPNKVETHLVHLALEYLDRVHSGELPTGWTAYMDDDQIPYYYNGGTGENTYDHPLAKAIKNQIIRTRAELERGDERWRKGTVADYWLAFGGSRVVYHNLRTRKSSRTPPHIARDAAMTIVKIMQAEDQVARELVTKQDIADAFHALDVDQSGSVSAEELKPVLTHLGGMELEDINLIITASDIDGDGEIDYYEFVDTLWAQAQENSQHASSEAATSAAGTYVVHGKVLDGLSEQMTHEMEAEAWKIEKEQSAVASDLRELMSKIDQAEGIVADAWTVIDYNRVLDLLARGRKVGIFDPEDPYHTGAYQVAQRASQASSRYEEAEAEKRAKDIIAFNAQASEGLAAQRDTSLKLLESTKARLKAVKITEFGEAVVELSLNGFLYPETRELERYVGLAMDMETAAQERADRMPGRALDLKTNMVSRFKAQVEELSKMVGSAEKAAVAEIDRRRQAEKRAVQAQEMEQIRKRKQQDAKQKAELEEKRRHQEAIEKLDADRIAAEEAAEKLAQERLDQLAQERAKMQQEMEKLRKQQSDEQQKVADWTAQFDDMTYATDEEREEAEIKREIQLEEMRIREKEAQKEREARMARMEAEMKAKEEKLRLQLQEEENERRRREEEKRALAEAEAQWELDMKREEVRTKSRQKRLRKRETRMRQARAALDKDDEDTAEEKRQRAEAVISTKQHDGDVWDACRAGDLEMLRAYFLVHGTELLLTGKMSRCHHREEWGRSLMHTAAWWGHLHVIKFLVILGADVNLPDTSVTRTTPLIEAARSGNRRVCELLIKHGAKIGQLDSHGDSAVHWAARRGWGTLIPAMLHASEEYQGGGSVRGVLDVPNAKELTPIDIAANETVRELIRREMTRLGEKAHTHKKHIKKMKNGLLKAKTLSTVKDQDSMEAKRYGKKKGKGKSKRRRKKSKKSSRIEAQSSRSISLHSQQSDSVELAPVKVTRNMRTQAEVASIRQANQHHTDLGDGGVPDELVDFMSLDDFHYGRREI